MDIRGADAVTLDGQDVVIRTGRDAVRMHAPVVYQDSATGRRLVDGQFRIRGSRIGFVVGGYDRARPLVIDPVVTYSTYLGGTGAEGGVGVGVDATGNIYVATGRPFGIGQVVKLSADGQTLLYSVTLGDMQPAALAVDAAGNAYVASACQEDFGGESVCPTLKSLASGGPLPDGYFGTYVTKLGPTGSILFSTSIGGFGRIVPGGIAVDDVGNMYVTAWGFALAGPPSDSYGTVVQAIAADFALSLQVPVPD